MRNFRYLPRNIQELYDPQMKRDRLERQNFERIFSNILNRYGHKIGKRYNVMSADMKDLMEVIDILMELEDIQINRYLFGMTRGHFPRIAQEISRQM